MFSCGLFSVSSTSYTDTPHEVHCLKRGKRTLRSSSGAPSVPPHGHSFLLLNYIIEVCQGALELPAVDCLSGLASILEGDAEVSAASTSGFGRLDLGSCVANLHRDEGLVEGLFVEYVARSRRH